MFPHAVRIVACDGNTVAPADMPLTPVTPSAVTGAPGGVSTVGARATEGREDIVVNMQDTCDSDTFNEA